MAPNFSAKTEREKKLKTLLSFASNLSNRFNTPRDATLLEDLQFHIRGLPLQTSSVVVAKQDELDKLGTELWNLSTRLRRDDVQPNGKAKDGIARRDEALCHLRVFAFLLLDAAGAQVMKTRELRHCIRLMKIALKTARVCIGNKELNSATKVLERAADYQDVLAREADGDRDGEVRLRDQLRVEYFAVRISLAWRQDRTDIAEHMFMKCKQLSSAMNYSTAESFADLLYEIGKGFIEKRSYEASVRWLERAYDVLGEQEYENFGPEAGELRLSVMQSIVQAYMKLKSAESQSKAWDILNLLETDYGEKMTVQLLKLELLGTADSIDSSQYYAVLLRMVRSIVLNETNFRTIMHHVHKLNEHNITACKILDDLIEIRLFREEKESWIEKAVITRIWVGTTSSIADNTLEFLQELFETVLQNTKHPLSAPATHAAQTLLWKRVEAACSQEQFTLAESWCRVCLHSLFEKAGELNKSKIARKIIMCALSRQDYAAARDAFSKMPANSRDEKTTRYLMYKVALHSSDADLAAESLDLVCRQSARDASLIYACVLEAQSAGNKRQAIIALQKVLEKYDYSTPVGVHLPALLRCTTRLLVSELIEDGQLKSDVMDEICKVFDGAFAQAKASRQRPSTPTHQLFTPLEFEWFSKNAYNLSLKYCTEMHPKQLVRLLAACSEFIKLLREQDRPGDDDLGLRLMFCHFLSACAFTALARAEDNAQDCLQYYLHVRKHSQGVRRAAAQELESKKCEESAQADIISKHFQVVKLELEAALKLEQWDSIDELFEECWKYKNPEHLETLADLILVIYSCVIKESIGNKYRSKILLVLQKIVNLTWRQTNNDIVKISRWIRCLFQLALTFDESFSLKCVEQASQIAATRQGVSSLPNPAKPAPETSLLNTPPPPSSPPKSLEMADNGSKEFNHYPTTELEWLATTSFNHGVDYYLQENDEKCRVWAEKGIQLAQWAEDCGQLRDLLMEKYSGLVWQEE